MERVPPRIVVVFDEAYYEYLDDPPDTLRFVRAGRNIAVLRTFSKIQGLANLRVGYAVAPPELIQVLHKTRQPFNVSGLAQTAALAALQDEEHLRRTKKITDEGRDFLQARPADEHEQIIAAGHEITGFDFVETADAVREAVESAAAFRRDADFDDGADDTGFFIGQIEHGPPSEEDAVGAQLFQLAVDLGFGQVQDLRHLRRAQLAAFEQKFN
jgi:histidinol-phosphate/aromatic aminotransferase/cobyric acid decarboxylase-like protein